MGWLYVRSGDPETRQKIMSALEQAGYKSREDNQITDSVYLIGFNKAEKTYTLVHTVMCAAAAAASHRVIDSEDFSERYIGHCD